ncbi:Uncharacterized protein DAT39_004145, partial [Clarias magur]
SKESKDLSFLQKVDSADKMIANNDPLRETVGCYLSRDFAALFGSPLNPVKHEMMALCIFHMK